MVLVLVLGERVGEVEAGRVVVFSCRRQGNYTPKRYMSMRETLGS